MSGISISISNEDVERIVKEQLVKSGLGKAIDAATARAMNPWDLEIPGAVAGYVREVAQQMLRGEAGQPIRDAVAEAIRAKLTPEFVEREAAWIVDRLVLREDR